MKFRFLVIVGSLFLFNSISLNAQNSDKGFFMLKMGQNNRAKTIFESCLAANKSDAVALFGMGEYFFETQKFDSAVLSYSNGVTADPLYVFNYIGQAKTLLILGNLEEAEKKMDAARKIGKKDSNILAAIARAYISGNNVYYDLCAKELVNARKINTKTPEIFLVEGLAAYKQKNYSEAAGRFDQALYYDSLNVEAFLNIASIYASTANKQEAVNFLNRLITNVPECYVAYRDLGNVYYDLGKYNEAKTAYESYRKSVDLNIEEKERYAYILFFTKNYELATAEVKELSNNDPENYIFLRLISYMNFETGKFEAGIESFNKFFVKIPESKTILMDYEYYAKTLAAANKDSLAVIAYVNAYNRDTTKLQYLDEAGKLCTKQKKYTESIEFYTKSIDKKENPVPLDYFQLGRSYYLKANSIIVADSTALDSAEFINAAQMADTLFARVSILQPTSYLGYIWRARANSLLDPESSLGLSKPHYEQCLTILLQNQAKYKKEIIEVYSYLGYYYYVKDNKEESKINWAKILEIDPENEKAQAAIKDLSGN